MSSAIASISGCGQVRLNTFPKQSLGSTSRVRFGHNNVHLGGGGAKICLRGGSRTRPNAAATAEPSLYETLGISENGTSLEIKRAYKQMARKFHPDVSPDPERVDEFTRRFIQIQEAYETLSDPKARAVYDRDMGRRRLAFGFGARKRPSNSNHSGMMGLGERGNWRKRWQSQLEGLVRKSMARGEETMRGWHRNEHVTA